MEATEKASRKEDDKMRVEDLSVWSFGMTGIIAGLLAGVLNNAWMSIFPLVTSHDAGPAFVDAMSVSILSFSTMFLGALIYYMLCNLSMNRGTRIYMSIATVLTLASIYLPFNPEIITGFFSHNGNMSGFMEMTLPMHIMAGLIGILFIPWLVYQNR